MIFFSVQKPAEVATWAATGEKVNEESRPDPHLQCLRKRVTRPVPLGT